MLWISSQLWKHSLFSVPLHLSKCSSLSSRQPFFFYIFYISYGQWIYFFLCLLNQNPGSTSLIMLPVEIVVYQRYWRWWRPGFHRESMISDDNIHLKFRDHHLHTSFHELCICFVLNHPFYSKVEKTLKQIRIIQRDCHMFRLRLSTIRVTSHIHLGSISYYLQCLFKFICLVSQLKTETFG